MTQYLEPAAAIERAHALARGERRILGIAGPPGGGKSTLAEVVVAALGAAAVLVPMDGFHLADVQLDRLGRAGRKGAPDTFDADGYVALLDRLRRSESVVYAPAFERDLEQPVAASIAVPPDVPLVVTEGNYLLYDVPPWSRVRALLDEVWWVDTAGALRRERLVARHVRFGKTPAEAQRFVHDVDEVNAAVAESGRSRADVIVAGDQS